MRFAFAFALAFSALGAPIARAHAAEMIPVLAVFEIQDSTKRPKPTVEKLASYLRVKLAEPGAFRIVDKGEQEAQLKKLLAEQKKESYKPCYDTACQIPLGKELAADRILRTKLDRIGKTFILSAEIIDLVTGASAGGASDKSDGSDDGLVASVERLAASLTAGKPAIVAKAAVADTGRPDAGQSAKMSEGADLMKGIAESTRKPVTPESDPKRARALTEHGIALFEAGSTSESISEFRAATEADPTYPLPRFKLGEALEKAGDLKGALEAFEYYAALVPNEGEGFLRCGDLDAKLGDKSKATEAYDQALKIANKTRNRALAGRIAEAKKALEAKKAVEAESAEAAPGPEESAMDAYVHGDYAQAIEFAQKAMPSAPVKAWRIIGASSCFLKDRNRALEAFNKLPSQDRQFIKYVCNRNAITIP